MYDADAVNGAVVLSARYIADRQLPDKAIDLMDEAGSRVRIAAHAARRKILASGRLVADSSAPWMELQQVLEAKEEAIKVTAAGGVSLHTGFWLLQGCLPHLRRAPVASLSTGLHHCSRAGVLIGPNKLHTPEKSQPSEMHCIDAWLSFEACACRRGCLRRRGCCASARWT